MEGSCFPAKLCEQLKRKSAEYCYNHETQANMVATKDHRSLSERESSTKDEMEVKDSVREEDEARKDSWMSS